MQISQNCLDLIKKWEGLFLNAYLDPVGIPTIGYGTTRYPNGQTVRLGDRISERDAERYLGSECSRIAQAISQLIKVPVNQNQFDALVSFSYNVGTGAFQGSTLLRKLNQGDYQGAANEFRRWVNGVVGGVKVPLPGLVSRRADERRLFLKSGGEEKPFEGEISEQDKVTWLEGYRDENKKTVVVAWNQGEVVEILTLEKFDKDLLASIFPQYKNARYFVIAPANKPIPAGERTSVFNLSDIHSEGTPPKLNRVLVRGSEGDDVRTLQKRLKDLGYYEGEFERVFGKKTELAVIEFKKDYFGLITDNATVESITWKKLWGDDPPPPPPAPPSTTNKNYLLLTKTNRKDRYGCYVLNLDYFKSGKLQDRLEVCCGAPRRQFFRTAARSRAMTGEPLPEGKWYIQDIIWADSKDNYYGRIFQSGIGPVTVPLDYIEPGTTERSAIEIHIDWNRNYGAPGTVGCIATYNIADYKRLVGWLRDTDPRDLYVDWKLGTCPKP
ncbi:MAG: glycoside hydrolase family protein [Okeania sp. SIO2F4]|uniref:glycoside hydrolase family protein n=1 Tax=Okeania sp. SIO2F4 TaxID=2607790 RepID=UPI00142B057B|nr:glycoside hydrolase family protein [Okeania sp. SIO2F4]NES08193.1 glycoside hydrolase family protein [Okeania sp. SIO2F4]